MERIQMLNTFVDNLSMKETIMVVDEYIQKQIPLHLMGINADKINALQNNARLRKIVNECKVINADGASVVWASKVLKKPLKERVAGIDLMCELLRLAEKREYSIYLLGARQEVVEKTKEDIQAKHPRLKIAGIRNGYFPEKEWQEIGRDIIQKHPQIVFVGITSPLKEYLVEFLQNMNINCVFMGVGGSFDVLSGRIPRAPKWVQNIGMEWLFRVIQEPGRLWKRYFFGNMQFILRVYTEKYRRRETD